MPELPEVETVRCQLDRGITGRYFTAVEKSEPFMLRDVTPEEFECLLPGAHVEGVGRLGKFILVRLGGATPAYLTFHLGMTGQLLLSPTAPGEAACGRAHLHGHSRFVFRLQGPDDPSTCLEFRDARKFGRVHLTSEGPPARLSTLGPDAWRGDWDSGYLAERLRGRRSPLKAFLLDQRHLAGIGNIYADEILWWTGLSPLRPAGSLDDHEVRRLAAEIRRRLDEGVRRLGCSLSDFVDTEGKEGSFQDFLRVYGRHGLICSRCGGTLARTVIAGRGTAYCPGCQH